MKNRIFPLSALSLALVACGFATNEGVGSTSSSTNTISMPQLPWSGGTGPLAPWGGADPNRWRPEAILANAMSEALNAAWAQADVLDAIVAAPVKMVSGNDFEFGDGQSNAAPSFEWWGSKRPPVVATLVRFGSAPSKVTFRFDRDLPAGTTRFTLSFALAGASQSATITATRTPSGDLAADWIPPTALTIDDPIKKTVVLVHPEGWGDWFPIWFRFPVRSIASLEATIPQASRTFADGGDVRDHERVGSAANGGSTDSVRARLQSHTFGSVGYSYFNPQDIHAVFPFQGHTYVTGVGQGWTWVADQQKTPFKTMYTCFERRRIDLEASAPDGGVPSGGGWHKIGDPAETVLNDLEAGPIVLGSAMNNPLPASMLPSGGFAYNLSDVATIRFVQPGEAFVTPRGGVFTDGNGTPWDQSNYHWYFFQQAQDVCTEEWVHPTVPNDALDFGGAMVDLKIEADGASTYWGQSVYVVGDAPELGAWNTRRAIALAPTAYPNWTGHVSLPQGASIQFKLIKMDGSGNVTWESGANRTFTTPSGPNALWAGTFRN